jgi:hypothetical protein
LSTLYSRNNSNKEKITTYYIAGLELIDKKDYEKGLELIRLGLEESEKIKDKIYCSPKKQKEQE